MHRATGIYTKRSYILGPCNPCSDSATASYLPVTKMELAGVTVCKATAIPLQRILDHRKLVATTFPQSATVGGNKSPAVDIEDQEMLHCAASQGMLKSVTSFLAHGNLICDMSDRFGRTPLHWAAEQGHRNVVIALLRAGACVDSRSQRKSTPIMLASLRGHERVVRVLLHNHASKSDRWPSNDHLSGISHWRSTALHGAAAGGHVGVVEALLDAGFERGQHDGAGLTPAEVSARQAHAGSPAITHLLLPGDMGGKLVHDYVNMTMQDVAMISGLVKGGAFLDWQDANGETPLHRAVHFHHGIVSSILLKAGANPNVRDHNGFSPLLVAACTGSVEIAADLLKAGADKEPRMLGGLSILHMSVENNRVDVVSLLLDVGASTEHRDGTQGQTPLSWACERCLAPIVRVLVEAGADLESRCSAGLTPLHWACRVNDAESVVVLLSAGADPGAVDQAAVDAVANSSSTNSTIVSMPVAIDVIGLGPPLDGREDLTHPSVSVAARRLDLVSVRRIESALKRAQQGRSWRRRGWLVILANTQTSVEKITARDGERRAAVYSVCRLVQSRGVDSVVEGSPCAHRRDAAGYRIDQQPQDERSDQPIIAGKRLRSINSLVITARGTLCQHALTRGDIAAREDASAPFSDLVGGLFRLAAVEVGLFRAVVLFI